MQPEQLCHFIQNILEDMKAIDTKLLDVRGKTSITDYMIITSGRSDRHVKALAETLAFKAKQQGELALGHEGLKEGEWALIDFNGVVVHVMQPRVRDYYQLERLWTVGVNNEEEQSRHQ